MTLDERHPWVEHAALFGDEPEWRRLARLTEAEDRERARTEQAERDLLESVEAEGARWSHWFASRASEELGPEVYAGGPG